MTGWIMKDHGVPDSRLTVLQKSHVSDDNRVWWLCKCNCNEQNLVVKSGKDLRSGNVKSCGCLKREISAKNVRKVQDLAIKAARISNKKFNTYKLNLKDKYGLYGIGYCSNTGREFYFDMVDYDKIKNVCWYELRQGTMSTIQGKNPIINKSQKMHSLLGFKNYDHIDRNELNNRKYNLRPATIQENARNHNRQINNTSGFIGVGWDKQNCKWRAYIYLNKKQIWLGSYVHKENAIKSRLMAEKQDYGEFAPQRHLFSLYNIQ